MSLAGLKDNLDPRWFVEARYRGADRPYDQDFYFRRCDAEEAFDILVGQLLKVPPAWRYQTIITMTAADPKDKRYERTFTYYQGMPHEMPDYHGRLSPWPEKAR